MINWVEYFYFFLIGAAFLLSVMGLWFTRIMPGSDLWNRRFFRSYFIVLMANSLSGLAEMILHFYPVPTAVIFVVFTLESLFILLPMPMLTVYLLHCCGKNYRSSRIFHTVLGLWTAYLVLIVCANIMDDFFIITADRQYFRGLLYPLIPLPILFILLLNLAGVIRHRKQLSRKTFIGHSD